MDQPDSPPDVTPERHELFSNRVTNDVGAVFLGGGIQVPLNERISTSLTAGWRLARKPENSPRLRRDAP